VDFTLDTPGIPPTHPDGAVLIGLAQIDPGTSGLKITSVQNLRRSYVGIDAQRVIHPILADPNFDPTALLGTGASLLVPRLSPPDQVIADIPDSDPGPEGWLDVQAGIFGRKDLYAAGNTVLGQDFDPGAKRPTLSGTRGNVKISGDLMLRGQLYFAQGTDWKKMEDLIAAKVADSVPDIQMDFKAIPPDTLPGPKFQAHGTSAFQVTSNLAVSSRAIVLPSITRVQFATNANVSSWYAALGGKLDMSVKGTATPAAGSQNQFDVTLTWNLAPLEPASATQMPVESIEVSYLLVSFKQ
jgi:hypothetical protein